MLTPEARAEIRTTWATKTSEAPLLGLADFVEATTALTLDPWQRDLCRRLEALKTGRGLRLLVHAPPQFGKSIIVSQRLPAWLLGHQSELRVKLACYNITHATRFGKIVLQLMQDPEYQRLFPDSGARVPKVVSSEEWSTAARAGRRDAQPSFKALGLVSGFVGQGADTLIIDDPYASPQDAASEVIRESVWTFWDESARVRLNENSNVVVMFHRYHEDDLAGRLYRTGEWEMLRYAAIADGDRSMPDPLERKPGEKLSHRFSDEFLKKQQRSGYVWLGQFQGRPTPKEGAMFQVGRLRIVEAAPTGLRLVRHWDFAATPGGGDYTAGVRLGVDREGNYFVLHVERGQWDPAERNRRIKLRAQLDGKGSRQVGDQDPGSAGVDSAVAFVKLLAGFAVKTVRVSGDKVLRAEPVAAQVNAGNVHLVDDGSWDVNAFIEELRTFPLGRHDDQVDAFSGAFQDLQNSAAGPYGGRAVKRTTE